MTFFVSSFDATVVHQRKLSSHLGVFKMNAVAVGQTQVPCPRVDEADASWKGAGTWRRVEASDDQGA